MYAEPLHPLVAAMVLPDVIEADYVCALLLPLPARLVCPAVPRDPQVWTELEILALNGVSAKNSPRQAYAGTPLVGLPKRRPLPVPVDSVAMAHLPEGESTVVVVGAWD